MMDIDDASRNGVGEIVDAKIESTISTITATTALTEHTYVLRSMLQTTFRQMLDVCNCNGDPDCEKQSKLANESFDWITRYTKEWSIWSRLIEHPCPPFGVPYHPIK